MRNRYEKVVSISVITSSTCNLNCSFCYLHKNQAYKEYHKLLKEAWQDGSYVNNVKLTIEKMGNNLNDIREIHFWGGETLIEIDTIAKNVPSFYNIFPNLKSWHMSTNWVINIDNYFNFLKIIDQCASQPTDIIVQVSIDGPPGPCSDQAHNGWEFYKNNFNKFLSLMNSHKFKYVHVRFHFKSTLSKDLYIKEFSTYEGIASYMKYMKNFISEIEEQCISRSVDIRENFTIPSLARPHIYSKEEGEKIRDIMYRWEEVALREFPEERIPFMYGMSEFNKDLILFNSNIECGEFVDRYTITFDGTIVECSGVFIDYYEPYQKELLKEGNLKLYEQALINAKHSFNPIMATSEEIEKWKWRIQQGYRNNSLTYMSLMMGVAKELCASKQIPSYYEDIDTLFYHLQTFQNSNGCSKENFQTTGIPYLTSVGNIREYFNGVVDYGFKMRQKELKKSFKYENKGYILSHPEQGEENQYEYNVGK